MYTLYYVPSVRVYIFSSLREDYLFNVPYTLHFSVFIGVFIYLFYIVACDIRDTWSPITIVSTGYLQTIQNISQS